MGRLFIVSGNSGSGKTSLMREVMGHEREIVSVTTRPMRPGEVDGVDYYFISEEEFDHLEKRGDLVEKAKYSGAKYGITRQELFGKLEKGNAYVIVTLDGFMHLVEHVKDYTTIFIYNTFGEAKRAMLERGDSISSVIKRLETYAEEQSWRKHYDYVIYNRHGYKDQVLKILSSIIDMWKE